MTRKKEKKDGLTAVFIRPKEIIADQAELGIVGENYEKLYKICTRLHAI